ncbi:hypothetical protein C8R45DRAFT_922678 [Mycena sanguinolenta]|nr:hypothetical protein C8R45DRAFT_922678 [Mycena sanguinolenta]
MLFQRILPIAATLLCSFIFHVSQILYRNLTSPLRFVPVTSRRRQHLLDGKMTDLMVINHVMSKAGIYQKPPLFPCAWSGERPALNPVFNPLTPNTCHVFKLKLHFAANINRILMPMPTKAELRVAG